MKELSKLSKTELRILEVQVIEALKTHHYLAISKAREQILHIAQSAGLSVEDILARKAPKRTKLDSAAAQHPRPSV
jgi:DNA-binding protein H-NS